MKGWMDGLKQGECGKKKKKESEPEASEHLNESVNNLTEFELLILQKTDVK